MLTEVELLELLKNPESERVEKTISVNDSDKFGEAICSFSNDLTKSKLPGYLLVGVNDDGTLAGLRLDEQILQKLLDFRTDGRIVPPPLLNVKLFNFKQGDIAVVEVQPHYLPPIRYKGKVCIRVGPRKGVANESEERILTEKRASSANTFDLLPCLNSSLEDISTGVFLSTYLPAAVDSDTLLENGRDLKSQLASLKFYDLKSDCLTNAGILMFGINPRYFIPGAYVQYVKFTGADEVDFVFEKIFEGDLTTQLKSMNDFIKSSIVKQLLPELGSQYIYNYPERAIKELLFNAVVHRDYQSNAPIKFYEYEDRIEISNAGGLYGKARPENFPNENDYRNPVLAEASKNLGFVNGFNIGVKAAIKSLEKNGNPPPVFYKDDLLTFSVKIYKRS
ncbi:MAG: putative DNA binding domain-containing protein [Ignavibacteriaceae bacterium]|nr:putative DNA binding domain-containing protein [Ignavibacteriaceae bacterium]